MAQQPSTSEGSVTRPMVILFAVLVSLPLWIEAVGLYQYLGIEIAVWMIYALGFDLLSRAPRVSILRARAVLRRRRTPSAR